MIKLTAANHSVTFAVRVQPRASRSEIVGEFNGALKVRLAAPPVDGEANEELIRFLAKLFGVSRSRVSILSGLASRNKVIRVEGMAEGDCEAVLRAARGS